MDIYKCLALAQAQQIILLSNHINILSASSFLASSER